MNKLPNLHLDFVREDDYVEYFVFPEIPENLSEVEANREKINLYMEMFLKKCKVIVEEIERGREYIWHKDEFQLQIRLENKIEKLLNSEKNEILDTLPPHLHGVTHYGDNITDEWFVVHMLYELTRQIPNCIVRVVDSDGEFLLIEAADVLPKWANPDTCEQRVYIANGCLQFVQNSPSNSAKLLPIPTAIYKIRQCENLYRVSKDIEDCIKERLKEFNQPTTFHQQIVRLPLGVACLLRAKPSLIAPAVRSFCERDTIDLKACRSMRFFPPEQRVRVNVRFTRCLYAMLVQSNYIPDQSIGWNLSKSTNTEEYKEDILGIKIACGFEILASQAKNLNVDENDISWRTYIRSLTSKGYFCNNLEGSQEYNRLLMNAKEYFKRNNERFRTVPLVGKEIIDILHNIDTNPDQFRDEENNLKPSDSDDWLNITAEQLDAMLLERYGPKKLIKPNQDIDAERFTKNITEFLEKQSALDGIENDSDESESNQLCTNNRSKEIKSKLNKNHSMRRACKENSMYVKSKEGDKKKIQPDEEESFTTHVRNFLDFVIPEDKWDSNSEMSDYEDEDDLVRNIEAMTNPEMNIDVDIKSYMAQMDKELSRTTIGQSFDRSKENKRVSNDEDFDDIETFQPININVNTLKNMMDSYKSQIGGPGPVSNLIQAMGFGMSVVPNENVENKEFTESTV